MLNFASQSVERRGIPKKNALVKFYDRMKSKQMLLTRQTVLASIFAPTKIPLLRQQTSKQQRKKHQKREAGKSGKG